MLCHLVYQTLEFCFQDNFENQMYTASWIDMMLSHLGHKLGAEHCLTELVGENVELLHKKVGKHTVRRFVELIRKKGFQAQFLTFLMEVCGAAGEACDHAQTLITTELLEDRKNYQKLLIQVRHCFAIKKYTLTLQCILDPSKYICRRACTLETVDSALLSANGHLKVKRKPARRRSLRRMAVQSSAQAFYKKA